MRTWTIIGLVITGIIALVLPLYASQEASRMETAQQTLIHEAIKMGEVAYAENCALCHGAAGEGIGSYPGLNNEGMQSMEYSDLFKVIGRGRYNTTMAAWGVEEGGVLNNWQIDQLIALIQQGDWADTAQTVEHLGLAPPTMIEAELSEERLAELGALPHGDLLSRVLPVYAANCAGCHGANGEGTNLAPPVHDDTLRAQYSDEELLRLMANGVPGTLMAGWNRSLTPTELDDMVGLIRYWSEIPAGTLIATAPVPIASTDAEVIAAGESLYGVVCATCHGATGQGRKMATALNTQAFLSNTNDQALQAIILQGIPDTRMPAWGGRLTDAEMTALVSYIRSWEATAPAVAAPTQGQGQGQGKGRNGQEPDWMNKEGQNQGWGLGRWFR
ncbi:c-type cytochrome [Anaerolineales bacterium HSG25]|nr:c-type cytochrome [Anaerolineales bacterium HSG25]